MSDFEQIRETVAQAYAKVVSSPGESCCAPVQKGFVVKLAGYDRTDLKDLPSDAVVNSFGCGNPLAFSEVKESDVVVDLGCGAGIDILLAARKAGPGGRVIGVDMTDEMIAKARETISASGLTNVEVRKGLIEDLPIESSSVDWVISNCVINLSPEKDRVFAEIARVLRPGGRMLVSDIIAEDLPERTRNDVELYCSCVAGAISEEAYCRGLRKVGLVDVEIRERIEYDTTHLQGLIEADLQAFERTRHCGNETIRTDTSSKLAAAFTGKVWSAVIFARKPE